MTTRISVALLILFFALPPRVVHAQSYVYLYEDQNSLSYYSPPTWRDLPEMAHWINWGDRAAFNITETLRWKISAGTTEVSSYARSVATAWDNIMPPWIGWQEVSGSTVQHLTFIQYPNNSGACGSGIPGCFVINSWTQHLTEGVNRWGEATIKVNFSFGDFSAAAKQYVVLHEFGHVVGLHDRYVSGSSCRTEVTAMDGVYPDRNNQIQPCHAISTPSSLDQSRVTTYYRQGTYNRDPSADNTWLSNGMFYSRWDDYGANEDKMRIELEYWSGSRWVYYNYFEWIELIGAHHNTGQGHDLVVSANLNSYGALRQRYHRMCVIPMFGYDNGVLQFGTRTCSTYEWWP
jgi:hypothetical protein